MAKSREEVKDLQRRLVLLEELDGRPAVLAEGVFVVRDARVREPAALVDACRGGPLSASVLQRAARMARLPVEVTPRRLAEAERELRTLETSRELRAIIAGSRRHFRRFGAIDRGWIAARRAHLSRLRAAATPLAAAAGFPPWFQRVLELVRTVHGDERAIAIVDCARASLGHSTRLRGAARARVERIVACLEGDLIPGTGPELVRAAEQLRAVRPGRSFRRRITARLAEALGVSAAGDPNDASGDLAASVRAAGEVLIASMPSTRSPGYRERLLSALALAGLLFDTRDRQGRTRPLAPGEIELLLAKLPGAIDVLRCHALHLADVLGLLPMELEPAQLRVAARAIAGGAAVAEVRAIHGAGWLDTIDELSTDAEGTRLYCAWAAKLAPHAAKLGPRPLPPHLFTTERARKHPEPAVLAACLIDQAVTTEGVAVLDAALGLSREMPEEVARITRGVAAGPKGLGRARLPELAAWLGDDALLDRWCHLCDLTGQPAELSSRLRRDFERAERVREERAHLAAIPSPTGAQRNRLEHLERELSEHRDANAAWTRRQLETRNDELAARAFRDLLDGACRRVLAETWRIEPRELTPAWRDAIRFWFTADENRALLGTLLRLAAAHPGELVSPLLPANRAWLTRAREHIDVDVWCSTHAREVVIRGRRCTIALEPDPLEVLRMGSLFDTCLALEKGTNAASTVINAADANKRVLYVRDNKGKVQARKLLAVSRAWTLLGYHLYIAPSGHVGREIAREVERYCTELARDLRAPFAERGEPEQLHGGFWYDDGAVSFAGERVCREWDAVRAFCTHHGVCAPEPSRDPDTEELWAEAEVWASRRDGTPRRILAAMDALANDLSPRSLQWIFDLAEAPAALRLAAQDRRLVQAFAGAMAARGPQVLLRLAPRLDHWHTIEATVEVLAGVEPSAELAEAILNAAIELRRAGKPWLQRRPGNLLTTIAPHAAELPLEALFALCDRVSPLLEDTGWAVAMELEHAALVSYRRAPDPELVVARLASAKTSRVAQGCALQIATRFALATEAPPPPKLAGARVPLLRAPRALRALRKLAQRSELGASSDYFAAILRQSAGAEVPPHDPARPPFEAVGTMALQLENAEALLEPFALPAYAPERWSPLRWELLHHRRFVTPWRRKLAGIARRGGSGAKRAIDVLVRLGAVEELEALGCEVPQRDAAAAVRDELARGTIAARAGDHDAATHELACRLLDDADRAARATRSPRKDPILGPSSREGAERSSTDLAAALEIVLGDRADRASAAAAIASIAARGPAYAATGELGVLASWIANGPSPGSGPHAITPASAAGLWAFVELRGPIAAALARAAPESWGDICRRVLAAGELPGFVEACVAAMEPRDEVFSRGIGHPFEEALLRSAVEGRRWGALLDLYHRTAEHGLALEVLERLRVAGAPADLAFREAVQARSDRSQRQKPRETWLAALCETDRGRTR